MNDTSLIEPDDPPEAELIPESQLIDGEPAPELPGMTDYPWANGDAATMLRSFIFQTVCDAEIDIPNQMARMAAAYEWITTGKAYVAPEEPRKRGKGGHLTPVEP
jgi:hypothetical protein